jgi:hypothetical protein
MMSNFEPKKRKQRVPNLYPYLLVSRMGNVDSLATGGSPFGKIELYSPKYYLACTLGGIVACGVTHAAVTPLDLVPNLPPTPPLVKYILMVSFR